MLYLRFLLYSAMCKISAEIKAFEIHGNVKSCFCGVSLFVRYRVLLRGERCLSSKISCKFKQQAE